MEPVEVVYSGYTTEHQDIDTEETRAAADSLMSMIESLLPNSPKMQGVLFTEGLQLASLSQKQGFIAGFTFAMELLTWKSAE